MKKILKKPNLLKLGKIIAVFVLTILVSGASLKEMVVSNKSQPEAKYVAEGTVIPNKPTIEITANLDNFISNNEEQFRFFAKMFDMDYDTVIAKLKEINSDPNNINENNIGLLKDEAGNVINYNSIDKGILEYFIYLENTYPEMISYNYRPNNSSAEYIEGLVQYFSSIYDNVDYKLMLSIGAAESGYYTSPTMLYKNNVYGGMGSNGLITYKNIEYGVWQYIKKMSEQYYSKGLNTIESIGYVFCPKTENGVKTVSSHWIGLVNKALTTYTYDIRYVSISQLNDLINNENNEI